MGQYWKLFNLDKKEYVNPHMLGAGLKLIEQLGTHPGTGAALLVLLAAMPEQRGGGDFDLDENWHGPERKFPRDNTRPGPMPEDYSAVARRTIGRWAGDRVALIGDYAEDGDIPGVDCEAVYKGSYDRIKEVKTPKRPRNHDYRDNGDGTFTAFIPVGGSEYIDISADVCRVIEHELGGTFTGDGWRHFKYRDVGESEGPYRMPDATVVR